MAKETKETKEKKPAAVKKTAEKKPAAQEAGIVPRLFEQYQKTVVPELMKKFHYKNVMEVPKLHKISINVGVGQATQDPKVLDAVAKDLELIVAQKPVVMRAKKAISNFKLRAGVPIAVRLTLRSRKMYEFMDRFISIAIPRIRDFRGLSDKSFDGRGNYTVGVKEHIIFPEVDVDKVTKLFGMDVTFVTTARTDEEAFELLKNFGMPFVKRQEIIQQTAG